MDELSRTLYDDIRKIAAFQIRGDRALDSICATDLAHDALERALRHRAAAGVDRGELLRRISRICRQVLVDRARARSRLRRGEGLKPLQLELDELASEGFGPLDMIALDEALERLAQWNERHVTIVELRFFGGLSMREVAAALELGLSAVEKDWRKARAWLQLQLEEGEST